MAGLLENIPGLAAHAATVPPVLFDRERAVRLVADAVSLLASIYPAGCMEWLDSNRPDVHRYIREAERDLDAAVDAEDGLGFARALEVYFKRYQRAFEIYNERPPVVEVQGDLI